MKILALYKKQWVYIIALENNSAYVVKNTTADNIGNKFGTIEKVNITNLQIFDEEYTLPELVEAVGQTASGKSVTYYQRADKMLHSDKEIYKTNKYR